MTIITEVAGVFCAQTFDAKFAHVWITVVQIISLVTAMMCLTQFYMQSKTELAPHNPWLKFFAFKLIVLVAYIQTVSARELRKNSLNEQWLIWPLQFIIDNLTSDGGAISPSNTVGYQSWKLGIPNLLLCFEMSLVALLHIWAYPWMPYAISKAVALDTDPMVGSSGNNIPLQDQERSEVDRKSSITHDSTYMIARVSQGGPFGVRAFMDMLNFWDFVTAIGRAGRWLFVDRKARGVHNLP